MGQCGRRNDCGSVFIYPVDIYVYEKSEQMLIARQT